ncbi:hypothetical protein N0V90_001561 [Kalmusia sp. IMI 367209]|nr:hypothetical protein N0V90_001561 [Kalmusia sp. IMI 367209]
MVAWNAEKDQVLLKGVFQFCDIRTSGALLAYLAEQIGEGCTPKAVSHRLNNIKNTGKPTRNPSTAGTPSKTTSAKSTPAKSPGSGRGRGRPPKKTIEEDVPANDFESAASPLAGRKRGHKEEDEPEAKKLKTEVDEEVFEDPALIEAAMEELAHDEI